MVGMDDLLKMYKLLVSREVARVRVIQENGPKEGRIREMGEMVDSRMVRLQQDEVKEITYLDFKWKHIGPGKFTFSLMLKINDLNCLVSGKRLSWAIYFENQNGRNVLRSGRGKLLFNETESRMELDEVIGEQRSLVRIEMDDLEEMQTGLMRLDFAEMVVKEEEEGMFFLTMSFHSLSFDFGLDFIELRKLSS